MDFKKSLFWIVVAVLLLGAVGWWAMTVPSMYSSSAELRDKSKQVGEKFNKIAQTAGKDDSLKTPGHVKAAQAYKQQMKEQLDAARNFWKDQKIALKFDNAPATPAEFDIWLSNLRTKLTEQAQQAHLQLPENFDKLTFKEPGTDDRSREVERRRDYRLRQMAIIEEVVGVLARKWGKQDVLKFEPNKDKVEAKETVDAGALALERISISPSRTLSVPAGTVLAPDTTTAEDRLKTMWEEVGRRSTRQTPPAKTTGVSSQELPYSVTVVDAQFLAPLSVVPAIAQALESTNRYLAVVTRLDYQRGAPLYPPVEKVAKAEAVPGLNTHYQEGPVRALVTFEIYEYDKPKADAVAAAAAAAAAAKTAPKKK